MTLPNNKKKLAFVISANTVTLGEMVQRFFEYTSSLFFQGAWIPVTRLINEKL